MEDVIYTYILRKRYVKRTLYAFIGSENRVFITVDRLIINTVLQLYVNLSKFFQNILRVYIYRCSVSTSVRRTEII